MIRKITEERSGIGKVNLRIVLLALALCLMLFSKSVIAYAEEETATTAYEETATTAYEETTTAVYEETTTAAEDGSDELETTTEEITEEETTEAEEETTTEDIELIAHRGFSGIAPENSLAAFEMAKEWGFTEIELDLRRCLGTSSSAARWVVSHDDSLADTIGISDLISETSWTTLSTLTYTLGNNVGYYSAQSLLSWEDVIELIKEYDEEGYDILWNVEIKYDDGVSYVDYLEEEIIQPAIDAGVIDLIKFNSFNSEYLTKIKSIDEDIRTGYISTYLTLDAINTALNVGAESVSSRGKTITPIYLQMAEVAQENGLKVGAYSVDDVFLMGYLYQGGLHMFSSSSIYPAMVSSDLLNKTYSLSQFSVSIDTDSYEYDGTAHTPEVTVSFGDSTLIENIHYQVVYSNATDPGTATVTVTGINNISGTATLDYTITVPEITGLSKTSNLKKKITLSWDKNTNLTGYIVYKYDSTTKLYTEAARLTADTNTYTFTGLTAATKYRFKVAGYVAIDGTTYIGEQTAAYITGTRPAKTKISSITRAKKKATIKWSAVANVTKYEVRIYNSNKKLKKRVLVKGKKKYTVTGLTKSKKYYVRVRAYIKTATEGKIYSVYTAYRKIKKYS